MKTETKTPQGYAQIAGAIIPLSKVEQHTADLPRFLRHLGDANILADLPQGDPLAFEILNATQRKNVPDLFATLEELAVLCSVLSDELKGQKPALTVVED